MYLKSVKGVELIARWNTPYLDSVVSIELVDDYWVIHIVEFYVGE
jgi:hypothetical protein